MDAKLVVVGGEAQAGEYPLRLPVIIGRSRSADLKLGHQLVSRKHCELFEADGQLMIRDLGSLNGTFVGEHRIGDATALEPGAKITIGGVTFKAVYGDVDPANPPDNGIDPMDFLSAPAATPTMEQTLEMGDTEPPITEFVDPKKQLGKSEDDDIDDFFASLQ